jgi:hypothetical protein
MADTPDNYHVVAFDLEQKPDGTRVTLSQAKLTHDATPSDLKNRSDLKKLSRCTGWIKQTISRR